MILMDPLVQVAVLVCLVGIVALSAFLLAKNRDKTAAWFNKYLGFLEDEEGTCPEWADPEKWKESMK